MKKVLPNAFGFTTFSSHERGFTLVELLVVISIIAILSMIGLTVYSGVQKDARDAKRKADVDAIANTLEAHYNDATSPCLAITTDPYCTSAAFTGASPTGGTFFAGNAVPINPTPGGSNYSIVLPSPSPGPGRTSYTVCATLENSTGNAGGLGDGVTFPAPSPSPTAYCRKSQR